jgi:hypothetical protein
MAAAATSQVTWPVQHPLVAASIALGAASLVGNVVWNCYTCGWDLDRVPWYQALLVVGVPFILTPLGVLAVSLRAVLLRSRAALIECAWASAGLALPWLFFIVAYILERRPDRLGAP